jgi:phosphate-selective porin OprO/OprP
LWSHGNGAVDNAQHLGHDSRLVDTGRHTEVDTQSIYGLELAAALDSFSMRGEYFTAKWNCDGGSKPNFDGYYLQVNWAITGEPFQYTQGKFLRIKPTSPSGFWEIAARYSQVNLNDLDILGGEEKNTSLAVNWYGRGNQLRVMGNVIFVNTDAIAGNQNPTIFQVRVQVHWLRRRHAINYSTRTGTEHHSTNYRPGLNLPR